MKIKNLCIGIVMCTMPNLNVGQTNNSYYYTVNEGSFTTIDKYKNEDSLIKKLKTLFIKDRHIDVIFPQEIEKTPVEIINEGAFVGEEIIQKVEFPKSLQLIKKHAFLACTGLTSVTFHSTPHIQPYAFYYCTNLKKVKYLGDNTCGKTISDNCYAFCRSLEEIDIPENVEGIGNYAFSHCQKLINITLPQKISFIGEDAFSQCTSLSKINLPPNIESIGAGAFSWCASISNVNIPDSVHKIENSTFANCTNLSHIQIGTGLKQIGSGAFFNCNSLIEVNTPKDLERIENGAFYGCEKLKKITFNNNLKHIGDSAFKGCGELTEIEIPIAVTNIGSSAFRFCKKLTNIVINNNETIIGDLAFDQTEVYAKLAAVGNQWAQLHLGVRYLQGYDVQKNSKTGLDLVLKSASQGNEEAKEVLKEFTNRNK